VFMSGGVCRGVRRGLVLMCVLGLKVGAREDSRGRFV